VSVQHRLDKQPVILGRNADGPGGSTKVGGVVGVVGWPELAQVALGLGQTKPRQGETGLEGRIVGKLDTQTPELENTFGTPRK
jgi:hypothetical protein